MMRAVVLRGALAGGLAGLVTWVFALILVEPLIDLAIGYEDGRGEAEQALTVAAGGTPTVEAEEELVTRGVQGTLGLGVGMVAFGVAMGLLFAVGYALAQGRLAVRPRVLAVLVAGAGFLTLYATPFLKYPASPPAVGNDDTIGDRSGLYLIMVIGSLVILGLALLAWRRLAPSLGSWNAAIAGIGVYVVLAGVLMTVLPSLGQLAVDAGAANPLLTETPQPLRDDRGAIVFPGFDADVLYYFRVYSFAAQLLLWTVLGLVAGGLIERWLDRSPQDALPGASARESTPA